MSVLDDTRKEARLSLVSRDDQTETVLQRMRHPCWLGMARFSPDGKKILFGMPNPDDGSDEWLKSLPRLLVLDVATKAKREVADVPLNASLGNVCWSPDGKRIAYMLRMVPLSLAKKRFRDLTTDERKTETEEFVTVADADGSNSHTITSSKGPYVNSVIICDLDWR